MKTTIIVLGIALIWFVFMFSVGRKDVYVDQNMYVDQSLRAELFKQCLQFAPKNNVGGYEYFVEQCDRISKDQATKKITKK